MKGIELGNPSVLTLDVEKLVETRAFIQGASGSGKSTTLRRILEQTFGLVQHLVIDPEGELYTLAEKFDYVVAGPGGDVPADPPSAALLAERLMELGASAVLNISDLCPDDQQAFVAAFVPQLIRTPKEHQRPCLVVVDEIQRLAPLNVQTDSAKALIDLAARGRKRELAIIAATQRISKVHKDVVAECLNKFVGLTNLDLDVKRAADELGFAKPDWGRLKKLKPGQFFVYGPALSQDVALLQIGPIQTRHGKDARRAPAKKPTPTAKIKAALAKLADLAGEAKAEEDERKALKQRVGFLESELRKTGTLPPAKREELIQQGYEKGKAEVYRIMKELKNRLSTKLSELGFLIGQIPDGSTQAQSAATAHIVSVPASRSTAAYSVSAPVTRVPRLPADDERRLDRAARAILNLLVLREGFELSKAQISGWSGYSISSSSFSGALSVLRAAGYLQDTSKGHKLFPGKRAEALAELGDDYDPNVRFSIDGWLARLDKGPRTMLQILLKEPGRSFPKEELSQASGYSLTSSSFSGAISELCARELAVRVGQSLQLNTELL